MKNAVLVLMFKTADVSKPSFYPLPTMTSSIFMPYSLAHAVQDLSCMLSSMALMATYKRRKWYEGMTAEEKEECIEQGRQWFRNLDEEGVHGFGEAMRVAWNTMEDDIRERIVEKFRYSWSGL